MRTNIRYLSFINFNKIDFSIYVIDRSITLLFKGYEILFRQQKFLRAILNKILSRNHLISCNAKGILYLLWNNEILMCTKYSGESIFPLHGSCRCTCNVLHTYTHIRTIHVYYCYYYPHFL